MMNFIRNVIGGFIVLLSNIFKPKVLVKRSDEEQKKVNEECKALALYQFTNCPFCLKVRRQMHRLNLNFDTRDCSKNENFSEELIQGGGKRKVPCLKIANDDGTAKWMYQSNDINQYLSDRFYSKN